MKHIRESQRAAQESPSRMSPCWRDASFGKKGEAIALFVYRIVRGVGSLVAALGGLDAIVFAGGIGENDAKTRAEVVLGCQWLGATLDPERNARGEGLISSAASYIAILVESVAQRRNMLTLCRLHTPRPGMCGRRLLRKFARDPVDTTAMLPAWPTLHSAVPMW